MQRNIPLLYGTILLFQGSECGGMREFLSDFPSKSTLFEKIPKKSYKSQKNPTNLIKNLKISKKSHKSQKYPKISRKSHKSQKNPKISKKSHNSQKIS